MPASQPWLAAAAPAVARHATNAASAPPATSASTSGDAHHARARRSCEVDHRISSREVTAQPYPSFPDDNARCALATRPLALPTMRHLYLAILALAGCANEAGNTDVACTPVTAEAPAAPAAFTGTVFTIVLENHSRGDIIGNKDAPYINQLATQGAQAAAYHDPYVHPSEPNYLWMAAGENFGIEDDDDPPSHHLASTSHIADQIEQAGLSWKTYQEGMGAPCGLASKGRYAAKHDPFVFFNDINGWDGTAFHPEQRCNQHVVDYAQLAADLAANAVPNYAFITPNLDDDMHDGSIAQADAWMATEVPKILASSAYTHGGTLFVLWDEGGGTPASDDPPFFVVSPNGKTGFVSTESYDASSYLKTVETILGLPALPCATKRDAVPVMTDLFSAPLTLTTAPAAP